MVTLYRNALPLEDRVHLVSLAVALRTREKEAKSAVLWLGGSKGPRGQWDGWIGWNTTRIIQTAGPMRMIVTELLTTQRKCSE